MGVPAYHHRAAGLALSGELWVLDARQDGGAGNLEVASAVSRFSGWQMTSFSVLLMELALLLGGGYDEYTI